MTSNQPSGRPGQAEKMGLDTIFCSQLWNAAGLQPKMLRVSRGLFFPETGAQACPDACQPSTSSRSACERQGAATSQRGEVDFRVHEFHHHKRLRASSGKAAEAYFPSEYDECDYEALLAFPRQRRTGTRRPCSSLALRLLEASLGLCSEPPTEMASSHGLHGAQASSPAPLECYGMAAAEEHAASPHFHQGCEDKCPSSHISGWRPSAVMAVHKLAPHSSSAPFGPPASTSANSSQGLFGGCDLASPLPSPLYEARSSDSVKHPTWSPCSDPMSEDA